MICAGMRGSAERGRQGSTTLRTSRSKCGPAGDPGLQLRPPANPSNSGKSDSADVAQLVEHFTRNEGVGSSSLPVGFPAIAARSSVNAGRLDGLRIAHDSSPEGVSGHQRQHFASTALPSKRGLMWPLPEPAAMAATPPLISIKSS
jgi:hypothetical protein